MSPPQDSKPKLPSLADYLVRHDLKTMLEEAKLDYTQFKHKDTDLDQGDLKYTTDFRDVYATLLGDVLGGDPGRILNGWTGRLAGVQL